MSLINCVAEMMADGKIDRARGKRMLETARKLERHYRKNMAPDAAVAKASEETLRQLEYEAALKRRQAGLQIMGQKRARADIDVFMAREAERGADLAGAPYAAVKAMLDDDLRAPYGNVERATQRIEFQAHAAIGAFIQRHRRNFLGSASDKAGLADVVRELHGEATGNARAKAFAEAIADTFEQLRRRFNAAGGAIGKLDGWGLPQAHDTLKVRRVGFDQWRADILPLLDVARMTDWRTGGPMTPELLEEALRGSFENIRTNGLAGDGPGAAGGGRKLANTRRDHRFFIFRDADAWLAYDAKYGTGDPFTTIMGHVRGMSRDIAMMERFGPNPAATFAWLLDQADRIEAQSARARPGALTGTSGGRAAAEKLWRYINGDFNVPAIADGPVLGRLHAGTVATLHGARDLLAAAWLGSAPISAVSDFNTQLLARKMSGLPQARVLAGYLKQLNPLSAHDRRLAIRLGLGMRDASHMMLGLSRYLGETNGPRVTSVIADDVLRLSGLNKFTEAGQRAFGLDFLRELGMARESGWDGLDDGLRATMERYGFDAAGWDAMRAAEPLMDGATPMMDWRAVAAADPRVADRMMDMVLAETASAVQEASASARAAMVGGRPGTIGGELTRSTLQFKSFGVSLLMNQARRIAALPTVKSRALYAAQFLIGMSLFGAAAIQLREIAKGKDPRPMDNAEFWIDALVQGGGLGIFGDLFGSFENDRFGSVAAFLAGPIGTLAEDVKDTVVADLKADDAHEHKGRHAVRLLKRYTPGGNLWYARAAFERLLLDQLSEEIDPTYRASRRAMERAARDQGQGFWWAPGDDAPDRAPDFTAATEGAAP